MTRENETNGNRMCRFAWNGAVLSTLSTLIIMFTGCAICCGPYDYHYPTHGGAIERSNPTWGRVGSIFSDPGPLGGPSADSNLAVQTYEKTVEDSGSDINLEPIEDEPLVDPDQESALPDPNRPENGVLPPPRNETRPSPDESTSLRGIRNQSRRPLNSTNRWR